MSSDHLIGAPFTLASLSKPISSTNGHVHAAGVCSISGIKKRKRTEIAVGIDGEGVSIYSVCMANLCNTKPLLKTFPAPKSATGNLVCAPAKRYSRDRPILGLPQKLFEDTGAPLYLCLTCRIITSRQVATRLLPRQDPGRTYRDP
jgi:hypothetical protein